MQLDDSHADSASVILSDGMREAQVTYLDLHIRFRATEEHCDGIPSIPLLLTALCTGDLNRLSALNEMG